MKPSCQLLETAVVGWARSVGANPGKPDTYVGLVGRVAAGRACADTLIPGHMDGAMQGSMALPNQLGVPTAYVRKPSTFVAAWSGPVTRMSVDLVLGQHIGQGTRP